MKSPGEIAKAGVFSVVLCLILVTLANTVFSQTDKELVVFSEQLSFGEIEVKRIALYELRNLETESASRVAIPALRDVSEIVRASATQAVIYLPGAEAVRLLTPLLSDTSPFVRRETAYALGKVGDDGAAKALEDSLMSDKTQEVRTACAIALGQIGQPSSVGPILTILKRKIRKKDLFLRRAAAKSLGIIAQRTQQQISTLTTPESFLPDKYKRIKKPKYRKLTEAFPIFYSANRILIETLRNARETQDVRREAAFALGEIGDGTSIPTLKANLSSKDYYLREICKEALKKVYANVNFANSDGVPNT